MTMTDFLDDDIPPIDGNTKPRPKPNGQKPGKQKVTITEDELAIEFTQRHAHELVYVAEWGRWLYWEKTHWRPENTLAAFDLARNVARDNPAAPKDAKTVAAIERRARADRAHARLVDDWNLDDWFLSTMEE